MGRSDAMPLGMSDVEHGVGHARVFPAYAKPRGARIEVWARAGVKRGMQWVDGLPSRELPSYAGAGAGRRQGSKSSFPTGIWSLCHY